MASNVLEQEIKIPIRGRILIAEEDLSCDKILCSDIIRKGEEYLSIHHGGNYHLHSPNHSRMSCYDLQVEE